MPVKTSVYFDDEVAKKLEEMANKEERSTSNFISLLINQEYERREMEAESSRAVA